ncbi:MAG: 4-hydroxybutyrate CoA-transferase, partial [Actinobacteria bacterium]|nr:4-hydroxybutyrate CoA-transferase [Actinomycetota bacterium]MSV87211.1 4-hydroxybutyrate CoA-transferase [Actinomycetota bacterium]
MRVITPQQLRSILANLPENPRIVASGNFATPKTLLALADEVIPKFRLHMLNAQPGIPDREGVTYESAFVGSGMRRHPRLNYIPSRLSLVPVLYRDHYRPDVVMLHTSAQRFDTVSLGTEVNILPAAIEAAKSRDGIVIAQANVRMPYTYGDAQIYENEIDYLVEVDEPLAIKPTTTGTDTAQEIGARISHLIHDNSTLQLGIGAVPDAVLAGLRDRKGLRIWTEMFSDGVLDLFKAGALDDDVLLTASFVFGSQELYEWLNLNRKVRMMRTERTNDPSQIARQAKMTSINAALELDLFDQANASHVRGEIYSGFGGSTDFIVGSLHSRGGQSFMALPSWHAKTNRSTIVPRLTSNVTSFQHSFVATENGIANCFGHSQN